MHSFAFRWADNICGSLLAYYYRQFHPNFFFFFAVLHSNFLFMACLKVVLSHDAFSSEVAEEPRKFLTSDGFYTALPFVSSVGNATTVAPFTITLILSSRKNHNSYAFATTSSDYPFLMPISFTFSLFDDYINAFGSYQCQTTCKYNILRQICLI